MNLAEYMRYSSDNQRCESIEEQQREIYQWAQRNGHKIVATYSDSALSGKYDYRPQFEKMLSDAVTALWDGVIVFDLSRFSRGGEYGIVDNLRLTEHGKKLLSVTERFEDDFGGKLIKHVKMLCNEDYITQLSVNVKRGHKQNAVNAQHNGGTPPLGYDVDPKTLSLVINEREAEAVRLIFQMFAQNKSYNEIIDLLNERGYKTKRNGNNFQKNSLFEILGNKKYIGVFEYGKFITQIVGRRKKFIPAPPDEIVTIENGCPAIVEKSLFERVQKMREEHRHTANPRAEVDYILRGKLRCAKCGGAYVGSSMKSHGTKCFYYVCSGKKNGKTCDNRNIKKEVIESAVINEIKKRYLSDEGIAWVTDLIHKFNKKVENPAPLSVQETALKVIDQLESRIRRLKEGYLDGAIELTEFKSEKIKLEQQLETHKTLICESGMITVDESRVARIIERYKNSLTSDQQIIEFLVDSVIIDGEQITVTLYDAPFTKKEPSPSGEGSNLNKTLPDKDSVSSTNDKTLSGKDSFGCDMPKNSVLDKDKSGGVELSIQEHSAACSMSFNSASSSVTVLSPALRTNVILSSYR